MPHSSASSPEHLPRPVIALILVAAIGIGAVSEEIAFGLGKPGRWVPDFLVGLALVGIGLIAARRDRGTGWLLILGGFAWWLGNLFPPLLYLHRGLLFQAVVTYPGMKPGRMGTGLLALAYVGACLPALASTEAGTALYGVALLTIAVPRLRGAAGQTRRYRLYATYAALALFVGTTGSSVARAAGDSIEIAGPSLLVYQATLIAAAILLTLGLRIPSSQVIADLVVELDETPSANPRETLSRLLGDPLLQIGTGDTEHGFVDFQGQRVELPDEKSDRIATLVEREKGDTTVIIHDRALAADGLLIEAVSTVARLSAANAGLNAQARVRLSDLTASRRRLLLAEEAERRRLSHRLQERTSSRLANIERILLPVAADGAGEPNVVRLVGTALEQLSLAREDLGAIVRGLHPWESEGDLKQALTALAARTPIPVEVEVTGSPVGRELATAVYYLCSEAVTNALKHASADHVHIEVHGDGSELTVTVSDDGVGGADPSIGSGLRGLADRVAALGGELKVDSPHGAGTRLVGTLPSEPGT